MLLQRLDQVQDIYSQNFTSSMATASACSIFPKRYLDWQTLVHMLEAVSHTPMPTAM